MSTSEPHSDEAGAPERARTRKLVIVDAANTVYRAFFALPSLRAPDGFPTSAVYGFATMLQKVLREERPDYVAIALDPRGPSFRREIYREYKATRDAQPEDLALQLPVVRELCEAHHIPMIEVPEYEADDVIATLVAEAPDDLSITIVSTDKDLMQLVSDRVELLDTMKDRRFGPAEVEERFGVEPDRLLDMRALVGDPSDNIPGVKGIGEKGAAKLIREWGSLEELLANAGSVRAKKAREALAAHADEARLSRRLAELRPDVPLPLEIEALRRRPPDPEKLAALFRRLGFTRLLEALEEDGGPAPAAPAEPVETRTLADARELGALADALAKQECVALVLVDEGAGAMESHPVGLAFALGAAEAAYLPVGGAGGLALEAVCEALRPVLEAPGGRPWLGRDVKHATSVLAERGLDPGCAAFDVEIAAFLLGATGARSTAALAAHHLGRKLRTWEELAGRGASARPASELARDEVADWAGAEACALAALAAPLGEALERDGLRPLFEEVEMPLTSVLARVERAGVRVDEGALARLSDEYESELSRIEGEIYRSAGERFLISSPKQLQQILFEKLKLTAIKKTKTGYSTDEGVLEQLAAHHELPALILAYRRLAKLKSTYVDALPPLVNADTGRIHPTFNQIGAATGRLSCTRPNLQNIPIRTQEGIRIREAFVPGEGMRLLSADYSQFELRILAHFSEDERLIEAFRTGDDVHRRTAGEVFGIPSEAVTAEQRARAKAINFGIIYGSSAFGIANQLGIATAEARATIDAYFARYRGVRRFLDQTVEEARRDGFVRTLLGRRRYLPDLRSRNRVLRSAAERMAVNSVIQGTEADLIKRAMVAVDRALLERIPAARMILQVHDELLFEVPEAEVGRAGELLRARMQDVAELRVPLVVDVGTGRSWREAH